MFGVRARLGQLETAVNEKFIPLIAQEILPSELPVATALIEEPGMFDTLAIWEQHLTELRSLPPSVSRNWSIQRAQKTIKEMRERPAKV